MWMNLDQLPIGKSMYTLYITADPAGTPRSQMAADEVDVVASSRATWEEVVNHGEVHPSGENAAAYLLEDYGPESRVIGVTNESDGYIMYDAFTAGNESGANDM